jgi:hypothetical protein
MFIAAGGNVGIGTDNPLGPLEVRAANRTISSDGILQVNSNNSQASDLGGSISFGGVWQSSSVTEWASVSGRKENSTSGQYGGYLVFGTRPHLGVITERMRIASNGIISTNGYVYGGTLGFAFNTSGYTQIGINTNSVGSEVILINNLTSGGSASVLQYRTSGTIEGSLEGTSSGLAISNVSDYRKKTDIRDLSGSLDVINNLQPRLFKFKDGFGKPIDKDFVGFIAHEIQSILPDSVIGTKDAIYTQEDIDRGVVGYNVGDPRYQTVSYTSNEIITHLVGSIKEQQQQIEDLKLEIQNLKNN